MALVVDVCRRVLSWLVECWLVLVVVCSMCVVVPLLLLVGCSLLLNGVRCMSLLYSSLFLGVVCWCCFLVLFVGVVCRCCLLTVARCCGMLLELVVWCCVLFVVVCCVLRELVVCCWLLLVLGC